MGLMITALVAILGFAGAVLFSTIVRQGSDEFKAWTPRLTSQILELAVSELPEDKRDRMREEWAGRIEDIPGEVGKWIEAFRHLFAAWSLSREVAGQEESKPTILVDDGVLENYHFAPDHVPFKSSNDIGVDMVITTKRRIIFVQAKHYDTKAGSRKAPE
jgi:hypothetical protein